MLLGVGTQSWGDSSNTGAVAWRDSPATRGQSWCASGQAHTANDIFNLPEDEPGHRESGLSRTGAPCQGATCARKFSWQQEAMAEPPPRIPPYLTSHMSMY